MDTSKIIGFVVLFLVWIWLVWAMLSHGGINLKNLLIAAMTAIIIFLPLYKKYIRGDKSDQK